MSHTGICAVVNQRYGEQVWEMFQKAEAGSSEERGG